MPPPIDPMPSWAARYDSNLRIALALIRDSEWTQLQARTGIVRGLKKRQYLSLFVELDPNVFDRSTVRHFDPAFLAEYRMELSEMYVDEFDENEALTILPVRIELDSDDPSRTVGGDLVADVLQAASISGKFVRIQAAIAHAPNEESIAALDLPNLAAATPQGLSGRNIVVGIVDDGCAFAHPDFLDISGSGANRRYGTRVLALWDQTRAPTGAEMAAGWTQPKNMGGREIDKAAIDAAIAAHSTPLGVDEDAVYRALGYEVGAIGQRATHGTKVMGIATANGNALCGSRGLAPGAGIVFVQLPRKEIETAPATLGTHIGEATTYVFRRTQTLRGLGAVVNISYGGYSGPHDGSSPLEQHLDQLLKRKNRAVVVAAGNGFEADCHATGTLLPGQEAALHWTLNRDDLSPNDCEIWYDGAASLTISLTLPDGSTLGPFGFLPGPKKLVVSGTSVGTIEHVLRDPGNGDNQIHVALGATRTDPGNATSMVAPSGRWTLTLVNPHNEANAATYHAWIKRDDLLANPLRQQSRFDRPQTHPGMTFGDIAGGRLAIAVGAFNAATNEVCSYSACGPTRPSTNYGASRPKPEICAPGEELALGGGVLTTASGSALPHRMNGTSAAAPHVAGIVALIFDLVRNHQHQDLTAATLVTKLIGGARLLRPNRRAAHERRAVHQKDLLNDLIGLGAISAKKTLDGF